MIEAHGNGFDHQSTPTAAGLGLRLDGFILRLPGDAIGGVHAAGYRQPPGCCEDPKEKGTARDKVHEEILQSTFKKARSSKEWGSACLRTLRFRLPATGA
jgi:hypothetical protein